MVWVPEEHRWTITINKLKPKMVAPSEDAFKVDSKFSADAYDDEKLRVYILAVNVWNEMDGSKRHRLSFPIGPRAA